MSKTDTGKTAKDKKHDASGSELEAFDCWIDRCTCCATSTDLEEIVNALDGIAAMLVNLGCVEGSIHTEAINMLADYAIITAKSARRLCYTK